MKPGAIRRQSTTKRIRLAPSTSADANAAKPNTNTSALLCFQTLPFQTLLEFQINESIHESIHESINESMNESMNQSMN